MLTNCQINNYLFTSQIGSGAYGVVFRATDVTTEKDYAIKAVIKPSSFNPVNSISATGNMKKSNVLLTQLYHYFKTFQNKLFLPTTELSSIEGLTQDQLQATVPHYREIALHLKVQQHENIVTIHQVLESPLATFIVMDYFPNDLFTSIVENHHFENDGLLIKKVYLQLCSALQYCHQLGVYHCDIKPENILLDENDNVKLCDFGLATTSDYLAPNVCVGSSYYMAPERVLCTNPLDLYPTATGDIWSIGIILINLTCIRNPWSKAHRNDDKTFHYYTQDQAVLKKILPLSDDLYTLLSKILQINPYDRIDLTTLMYEVSQVTSLTKDGPLNEVPALTVEQYRSFIFGESSTIQLSETSQNNLTDNETTSPNSTNDNNTILDTNSSFKKLQTDNGILKINDLYYNGHKSPGKEKDTDAFLRNKSTGLNISAHASPYNSEDENDNEEDDDKNKKRGDEQGDLTNNCIMDTQAQYHPFQNSLQYLQMSMPTVTNQSDNYW
ncbi:hypothetical protein Kpol_1031p67 [Vanderwaltozyma polyspora DSM 70294]|uniref:Protein kinase domain-containing protein n=1 Tax=Vanderwaltozyma polyspora (strain ATCC 22028 / DSM 70294 / BCRC 21397 / CBS 2163 / NBRC 10782 / NRRL Y-8283 / UCD 57-17) TaxID=436907 RepID=A7THZ8_VANPO|nr:uncharacterized protein Kpol_1031p67 [Vanderwaltozyma polyspora DSM 70294]EDO18160.1 hypothetical protein Kpol_1031p67 [Vanderwaltozyma polyspora DSM 70294]